jgi:RNA polymerase sigma factor (sigma-70 family)
MPDAIPSHLADLLHASSPEAGDLAWQRFIAQHSRLIMSVARAVGGDYDAAMDRYAFILDHLRRDDFRKLRSYTLDSRCKFTTWLVVVCRRLCIDQHRSKFGRVRATTDVIELRTRRSLTQSLFSSTALEHVNAPDRERPDFIAEEADQHTRLEHCLGRLEARDRLLIKLRFEDDMSAAEIARLMDFATPFHVYRRLKAVLNDLRIALTLTPTLERRKTPDARPLNIR